MKPKDVLKLLKDTGKEWNDDKVPLWAAALAYYTIFSLAPLLLIAIAIAGLVFGETAARGEIVGQIQNLVGKQGAEAIQSMIQNAHRPGSGGTIATIVGVLTLLFWCVRCVWTVTRCAEYNLGCQTKAGTGYCEFSSGAFSFLCYGGWSLASCYWSRSFYRQHWRRSLPFSASFSQS